VRPLMESSVGDAYDSAIAERCLPTLECELLDKRRFAAQAEARMAYEADMETALATT